MNEHPDLERLSDLLGHRFADRALMLEALTHSSALNPDRAAGRDYQRLEFLGDRVLGLIVAAYLVKLDPDMSEGDLAIRLNALVRRETLAEVADEFGLADFIIVGAGERDVLGRGRASILADIFEAILGALYLDGGIPAARQFAEKCLQSRIANLDQVQKDAKSRLQEFLQGQGLALPSYSIVSQAGPPHAPTFTIRATSEQVIAEGRGSSRREAERDAAEHLLEALTK